LKFLQVLNLSIHTSLGGRIRTKPISTLQYYLYKLLISITLPFDAFYKNNIYNTNNYNEIINIMDDSLCKKFYSINNLRLAYTRIRTGQNIEYKNYYRDIILSYELAEYENLECLSKRLEGGSYNPYKTTRFYLPKPNGLQRPITFLQFDDLIVYQAFANIIAEKFLDKKRDVECKEAYSNILNKDFKKSIFFFEKWQVGYQNFKKAIKKYYTDGNIWVAHFDLAAYYETIDHDVLSKQISPRRTYIDFCQYFTRCLGYWTTNKSKKLSHGIPQGPIASNLISEIYLLPVDTNLKRKEIKYVRYVDDIKIFGKTREEVLEGAIFLEQECREIGLIPQSSKNEIIKAENINEATGKNPSLSTDDIEKINVDRKKFTQLFKESFNEKSFNISIVKYMLKTSYKNKYILEIVLRNLKKRPELIIEFCIFLNNYINDSKIGNYIFNNEIIHPTPYKFAEGKLWELLSQFNLDISTKKEGIDLAIERLIKNHDSYSLKLGLYKFISSTNNPLILKWIKNENSSFIQAQIVPYISPSCYDNSNFIDLINTFSKRTSYEPSIVSIKQLFFNFNEYVIDKLDKKNNDDSGVLDNILGKPINIDPIGQILKDLYGVNKYNKWDDLFKNEYEHSNRLLFGAKISFYVERNLWINYTDSFNDILIRKFIEILNIHESNTKWPPLINRKYQRIDFGVLLDANNNLSVNFPKIINPIRDLHNQRNINPISHPYEKKTGKENINVSGKNQKYLSSNLKISYNDLIIVLKKYI